MLSKYSTQEVNRAIRGLGLPYGNKNKYDGKELIGFSTRDAELIEAELVALGGAKTMKSIESLYLEKCNDLSSKLLGVEVHSTEAMNMLIQRYTIKALAVSLGAIEDPFTKDEAHKMVQLIAYHDALASMFDDARELVKANRDPKPYLKELKGTDFKVLKNMKRVKFPEKLDK